MTGEGLYFGTLLLRTGESDFVGISPLPAPNSHSSSLLTRAAQVDLGEAVSLVLPQTKSICRLVASSHHLGIARTHKQLSFPSHVPSAFGLR